VLEQIRPADELYIAAYPHFNVGEIIAIAELWEGTKKPIVVFNGAMLAQPVAPMHELGMLWDRTAALGAESHRLLCIGELDRVRSGYYPSLFYPKVQPLHAVVIATVSEATALLHMLYLHTCFVAPSQIGRLAKTFIPSFEAAYYIHNFKGVRGGEHLPIFTGPSIPPTLGRMPSTACVCNTGSLFRCYPGPYQVLRRYGDADLRLVHSQDTMPTLKQVAIEILPNA
jgi:Domain of unknown function (DUF1995)